MSRKYIYTLIHVYRVDKIYNEYKFIGIYSSRKHAEIALEESFSLSGFKDHPKSCFKIKRHLIDDFSKWIDGFEEGQLELLY